MKADIFARWWQQLIAIGVATLVAVGMIAMLVSALARQIGRVEASNARLVEQASALRLSEMRQAEQAMALQSTLAHMNQGLIMVDATGTVVVSNRRAADLLDLPPSLLEGRPAFAALVAAQSSAGEFEHVDPAQRDLVESDAVPDHEQVYERRRPNGIVLEIRSVPLPGGGMVRTYTDITARAEAEGMLALAASQDQLTGLANRNGFGQRLDAALSAAQRTDGRLALLCLDLDGFKAVNDTTGHEMGDLLLQHVAKRVRATLRDSDLVARMGGDEFAVVLEGIDANLAEQVAQRLLESIRLPYLIDGRSICIGVSIGIATCPLDGGTSEQLLRNADAALYQAKAAGRNAWRVYASDVGQRDRERKALESDLRMAVSHCSFTLAYQRICDAATNKTVAFEALLRWTHPIRGQVSPAEFIPVAEQLGLMVPLGRWVIRTACAEAARWPAPARVAVNLSPAQFREPDLEDFVRDVLAQTGLPGSRLELEVTEGLLLEHSEQVVRTMQALRGMGVRMVLDDFGTAHSGLSYLRGFPFDAVKIDRSFLRALNSDRQARALVEAMLTMAAALGLEVVGEGVETQEQLAMLRHLRCDLVQGWLLGRPVSCEAARERLAQEAVGQPALG